jgi:hypothetical protein
VSSQEIHNCTFHKSDATADSSSTTSERNFLAMKGFNTFTPCPVERMKIILESTAEIRNVVLCVLQSSFSKVQGRRKGVAGGRTWGEGRGR